MFENMRPAGSLSYRFVKRLFDISCSIILLIPIGIVLLISAIVIKLEDGGAVFYLGDRVGMFGRIFKMYKLRSMKVNAPDIRLADGSTYNGDNDPRVTKFGKVARKTSIDELPQVINILKGDMSFIGPRPDTPLGLAEYTEDDEVILRVRPGITGYNQAVNRNSVLTREKIEADKYYVNHLSLLFDVKIIFMTIRAVLTHRNVNRDESTTFKTYVIEKDGTKSKVDVTEINGKNNDTWG